MAPLEECVGRYRTFVGLDESGHGDLTQPEVVVAAISRDPKSVERRGISKHRRERRPDDLFPHTLSAATDYRFILLNSDLAARAMYDPITKAAVIGSLVEGFQLRRMDEVLIYIDGNVAPGTKEGISSRLSNGAGNISVNAIRYGGRFDRIYKVVNLADEIAYVLYSRQRSGLGLERFATKRVELRLKADH